MDEDNDVEVVAATPHYPHHCITEACTDIRVRVRVDWESLRSQPSIGLYDRFPGVNCDLASVLSKCLVLAYSTGQRLRTMQSLRWHETIALVGSGRRRKTCAEDPDWIEVPLAIEECYPDRVVPAGAGVESELNVRLSAPAPGVQLRLVYRRPAPTLLAGDHAIPMFLDDVCPLKVSALDRALLRMDDGQFLEDALRIDHLRDVRCKEPRVRSAIFDAFPWASNISAIVLVPSCEHERRPRRIGRLDVVVPNRRRRLPGCEFTVSFDCVRKELGDRPTPSGVDDADSRLRSTMISVNELRELKENADRPKVAYEVTSRGRIMAYVAVFDPHAVDPLTTHAAHRLLPVESFREAWLGGVHVATSTRLAPDEHDFRLRLVSRSAADPTLPPDEGDDIDDAAPCRFYDLWVCSLCYLNRSDA